MLKGDKKTIKAWIFYDWANSVYNLVVSSAIFPIFYDAVTTKHYLNRMYGNSEQALKEGEQVKVLFYGMELSNSALFSFVLSASFLVVSILSPMLSGIADYTGSKKRFMRFFCYVGAFSCFTLFYFDPNYLEWGMMSVFFASIGFWNSLVFYNAFLPEISESKDFDRISAKGFSMGYFGSMILLIICLIAMKGFDMPAPWCFVLVSIWWVGFSQITFFRLPNNVYHKKPDKNYIWKGFIELKKVYQEFRHIKRLKIFLLSFFFYNTGVQTVMLMATIFANKEIEWEEGKGATGLIISILLIQILGALGAFLMSKISSKVGNIRTLILSISIWLLLCISAYFIKKPIEFYLLAAGVGLVMGGIQAISRSTYSKFLPETTDHASYFSFYDATEKIGIVCGVFFFGFSEIYFGSIRFSVISISIFFFIGLIIMLFLPKYQSVEK
ncbi:MAG: MFS transporter [Flavobacteriia bacterium]|nr:MFS transporter [Flavobacteriia bacterium]